MANEATFTARLYGEKLGDYQLVSSWWRRHNADDLPETMLPPVGVIVEECGTPLGALWCYESFGIGVCFLEWPCTAPGLGPSKSLAVMKEAIDACIVAAKAHGSFSVFRCSTLPAIARLLPKLGFVPEHGGVRHNFMLRKD